MKSSLHSPQLEKARAQQRRPNAANNKFLKNLKREKRMTLLITKNTVHHKDLIVHILAHKYHSISFYKTNTTEDKRKWEILCDN